MLVFLPGQDGPGNTHSQHETTDRPDGAVDAPCKLRSELKKLQKKLAAAHQEMLKSRLAGGGGELKELIHVFLILSDVLVSEQVKRFPTKC